MTDSTVSVTAKVEIALPKVPHFLKVLGRRETVAVSELSKDELQQVGEAWTRALVAQGKDE